MAGMSQELVLRLLGDASSATRALHEAAAAADVTVSAYRKAERQQDKQARIAEKTAAAQAAAAQKVGKGMLVIGAAMAAGLGLSVKAAMDWESAWAGVVKVVDGTPAELAALEKQLRSLTSVLPATHGEIAAVAAAAGQLGIQRGNIAGFTKTMIELGVATNISAEQGAVSLARLMNIMGTSQSKVSNLGSTIVWLGNNFATTESEILDMTMRLSGAGKVAGLTEADVMGIATALSSVGIESQAGGSAFSKVITQMSQAVSKSGDELDKFAATAGMSADQFAAKWKKDPAQAIASFVSGLGNIQKAGGDVFGTLDQLGISELRMRDALLRSAGAGDQMAQAITGANKAFGENNALQTEAAIRFATTESKMKLFRNSVTDAAISLGSALLPPLTALVDAVKFVVDGFNDLPGPVKAGAAILLGAVTAASLLGGALLTIPPRVAAVRASFGTLSGAGGIAGKIGSLGRLLGPIGLGVGLVTTAVSVFSGVLSSGGQTVSGYASYVDELTSAFQESNGAIDESIRKTVAKKAADEGLLDLAKQLGIPLSKITDAILGNGDAYEEVSGALEKYGDKTKGVGEDSDSAGGSIQDLNKSVMDANERLKDSQGAEKAKKKLDELAGGADQAAGKAKDLAGASEESGDAMQTQADAAADAKDAIDQLKKSFDELTGKHVDLLTAQADMTLQLESFSKALQENGASFDTATEAGAKNTKELAQMRKSAIDVTLATYDQVAATEGTAAAYDAAAGVFGQYRGQMIETMVSMGMTTAAATALVDSVLQMPEDMTVEASAPGAPEAQAAIEALHLSITQTPDGKFVLAEAPTAAAIAQLNALGIQVTTTPDNVTVLTPTPGAPGAITALQNVAGAANSVPSKKDININVFGTEEGKSKIIGLQGTINALTGKSVTMTTTWLDDHRAIGKADGGYVKAADGRSAMYASGGSNILWAEPETGGEWYIPQSSAKRGRSKALAGDMLNSWGYAMVPQGQLQQNAPASSAPVINVSMGGGQELTGHLTVNDGPFAGLIEGVVTMKLDNATRRANSVVRS